MNAHKILALLILFSLISPAFAKEKMAKNLQIGADLYLSAQSEDIPAEYYRMGAKLRLYFDPLDNLSFKLKLKTELKDLSLEELFLKYTFTNNSELKFGLYENDLMMEDWNNRVEAPFAYDSSLRNRLASMGWYSNAGLGASYLFDFGNTGWHSESSVFFTSTLSSVQLIQNINYEFGNHNTGLYASYLPVPYPQSVEPYYYYFDVYVGALDQKLTWNYKVDISLGKNIGDPGGNNHYPGGAVTDSHFFAADAVLLYNKSLDRDASHHIWTPGLGLTYIMHNLELPQASSTDIKWGNKFTFKKQFYIHSDLGLRTNIYYDPDLTTGLELIWAISSRFRY